MGIVCLSIAICSRGQTVSTSASTSAARPADTPYEVVSRDANSRVWERTEYEQGASGEWVPRVHRYIELATGLNYKDSSGNLVESKEEINPAPGGGAEAVQGEHKVYFPYDIYSGAIEIITPDGEQLKCRPLGISYFDGTNSVMVAELTNSVGQIISGNQVIYTNVLDGVAADLVLTYRKGGLESELVFREQPPAPEVFGLRSENARLELLTEWFNPPEPEQTASQTGTNDSGQAMADTTLRFGAMTMVPGKAFAVDATGTATGLQSTNAGQAITPADGIPVYKTWTTLEGRTFLVEEVWASDILPQLKALPAPVKPPTQSMSVPANPHRNSAFRLLPSVRPARPSTNSLRLAQNDLSRGPGVSLDYTLLNSGITTNYTFQGDTTYLISGPVGLGGALTIEGGTVVKFANTNNPAITFYPTNTLTCQTAEWHPAIFTAVDDNTVGQNIGTGSPSGLYGSSYLSISGSTGAIAPVLKDIHFRYAANGIIVDNISSTLRDVQFVGCGAGVVVQSGGIYVRNALFAKVTNCFVLLTSGLDAQNVTFAGDNVMMANSGSSNGVVLNLTNCLFASVPTITSGSYSSLNAANNGFYNSPGFGTSQFTNTFYPFQTVGSGSYYLTNGTAFADNGTTNIDPIWLAELPTRATFPPIVYSSITISTNIELGPRPVRDTNTPDLGYHYDPLDWCFGRVQVNSNITFDAGTAVGWFELYGGNDWGISLSNDSTNRFNGTVTSPCVFARYNTVQEGNGTWPNHGYLGGVTTVANSLGFAEIDAKFLHCYAFNWDPNHFRDFYAQLNVHANECEFYDGDLGGYWVGQFFTNCLFDREPQVGTDQRSAGIYWRNCTMHGGGVYALHDWSGTNLYWPVWIENCAFDGSSINMSDYSGGNTNITYCNYNAFLNGAHRLIVQGSNDVVVTNTFTWQTGPLGFYYQATNSPLLNMGSVPASVVGLYHYTVLTNQTIEGTNIVSIGYHYVALDSNGNPLDFTGDGIPDYIADSNGNGVYDPGVDFADWLLGIDTQPQSQNVVQGTNVTFSVVAGGLTPFSYQWQFNGTAITGATGSNLTLLVVTNGNEGNYTVVVSNSSGGSVTSSPAAVLTVNDPLTITTPPASATVLQGGTTNFGVIVGGHHGVFQWYGPSGALVNGSQISGATTTNVTISNIAGSDAGNYYVVATNLFNCVTSTPATLTVITNPALVTPPANLTNIQADDVTFSVGVNGVDLFYQWWLTNNLETNAIPGATNASYTQLVVQTNDAGTYAVVITNAAGSTNASGTLTVLVPPWITQQPLSITNNVGANVSFSATAFGTTNLSYQWFKNGSNAIANATNSVLNLNNVQVSDAAGYFLVVSNIAGTNRSAWAWLSVVSGGTTNFGWGSGSGPVSTNTVSMISPTNTLATNPAIYLFGPPISIRASATSQYDYITNVAFYSGTNLATCTNLLGSGIPGTNITFGYAWTNSLHGTNTLLAVATDNTGLSVTSAVVYVIMDNPPVVSAGPNQTLVWPPNTVSTNLILAGSVSDDGLPYGITNINWIEYSGNTTVTFSNRQNPGTIATFTNYGSYVLRLRGGDGFVNTFSYCTINWDAPPVVAFVSPNTNPFILVSNTTIVLSANAYGPSAAISGVTFYDGSTSLGAGIATLGNEYNLAWTSDLVGNHQISAVATDYDGLSTTSTVSIIVVPPLTATITAPANTQLFVVTPTNIVLTALVTNYAGFAVTSVSFSNQLMNLGAATNAGGYEWQLPWDATNGIFTVTVVAHDSGGDSAFNSVTITNNAIPVVTITSPTNLQSFLEVTNITISATASDSDGSVTNVAFYGFGTNLPFTITQTNTTNYSLTWSNLATGYYPVTAIATDNRGASGVSQIVIFTVKSTNTPPAIVITSPTNNEVFLPDPNFTITAAVTNGTGTVTNVEFFANGNSLGSVTNAPYSINECCWKPGTYVLYAVASDTLGFQVASAPVTNTITADSPGGGGYWDADFQETPFPFLDGWFSPLGAMGQDVYSDENNDTGMTGILQHWDGTNWTYLHLPAGNTQIQMGFDQIYAAGTNLFITGLWESNNLYAAVYELTGPNWFQLNTNDTPFDDNDFEFWFAYTNDSACWVQVGDQLNWYCGDDFIGDCNFFEDNDGFGKDATIRMVEIGSDIYIGGSFQSALDTNIVYVAKLNPQSDTWERIGNGHLNGPVYMLCNYKNQLVIGGAFTNAGGNPYANHIAMLVGNTWTNLGTGISGGPIFNEADTGGIPPDGEVWSLAVCANNLFAGGNFTTAGGNTNANGIAVWNGTNWNSIGRGLYPIIWGTGTVEATVTNLIVNSIVPRGNSIYVGGQFNGAWGDGTNQIRAYNIAEATWIESQQKWVWNGLDLGLRYQIDYADGYTPDSPSFPGWVDDMAIVNGPNPGSYDLYVSGGFSEKGSSEIDSDTSAVQVSITRWRVGYPPSPSLPTIVITNPPNGTFYTNLPSSVAIGAYALSTYTNITTVEFFVDGSLIGSGSTSDGTNYSITWNPTNTGPHFLTAEAVDAAGLENNSTPVSIDIIDPNNTVTALNDFYVFPVDGPPEVLNVLTNDSSSLGKPLQVVAVFPGDTSPALGTPTISIGGKSITYTINPNVYGTDQFTYWVTDGVNTNQAYVTVKIRALPIVAFDDPSDGSQNNTNVMVAVDGAMVSEDSTITNISLYVNGNFLEQYSPTNINYIADPTNFFFPFPQSSVSPQTTYAPFSTNWSTNAAGFYAFTAIVEDSYGFSNGVSSGTLIITNPATATTTVTAAINNLSPSPSGNYPIVTSGFFDLQGTAADSHAGDSISYQVLVHPFGDEMTVLANVTPPPLDPMGFHDLSGNVNSGDLGTNDFSTLANGMYDLELVVRGGAGEAHATNSFQLQSNLKIGEFSFSEQDLTLPVSGVPLTVTRTYNSLNPDSGPFGTSWSFALNDMDVQLDDQREDVTIDQNAYVEDGDDDGSGSALPTVVNMRVGGNWDVTLTMPNGQRVTFQASEAGGTPDYSMSWNPPPGVHATLYPLIGSPNPVIAPLGADLSWGLNNFSGLVWSDSDSTFGPQPYQYSDIAGWVLTTADNTQYYITRGSPTNVVTMDPAGSDNEISARVYGPPKLTMIKPVSGDSIVINDNGVFHYDPTNHLTRSILFDQDNQGRIIALHDPNGGSNGLPAVQYVYDNDNNNLIQVLKLVDRNNGIYTTNKYDYNNANFPHYITSMENGDGIPVAQNFYDDSGRLIAVQDANGTKTYFNHSTTNNTDIVVDRLGNTNSYVYDLLGNIVWQTNALGQVTAWTYSDSNNPTLETAVTNAYGTAVATWTLYAYDNNGNKTNVVSMGHTNSYLYDGNGNLLSQIDPLGDVTSNMYDDNGNLTNTIQYDAHNNPIGGSSSVYVNGYLSQTLDANGQVTETYLYDDSGNLTNGSGVSGFSNASDYDANGNQTSGSYQWTPPGGGSAVTVTTSTYYDAQNRVTQTIDAFGNTNSTSYDTSERVIYTVDKFGNTNNFLYDALGNLIQTTYANGTVTRTAYDAAGRPYLTTDRNGMSGTMTSYDAIGRATNVVRFTNVILNITYSGSVAECSVGSVSGPISTNSTVFDAAGRVISKTTPDGVTSYDYYPDGQLMQVIDPLNDTNFYAYDAADRQTNMVDALNRSTKFQYDGAGRTIATIYDDNSYVSNVFNNLGQRVQVVDQAQLVTHFGYSISGQLANVTKPAVPDPENGGTPSPAWSYLYDSYGHQFATVDPKGRAATNLFDAFGRRISERLPLGQTNYTTFNSFGQMATNYDFEGQRTEFYYDQYGRLTNKFYFYSGQTHPSNAVSYAYNQLNQVTNIIERYGADADNSYAMNDGPRDDFFAGRERHFVRAAFASITTSASKWGGPSLAIIAFCAVFVLIPGGRKLRQMLAEYYLRGGWKALPEFRFKEQRISPYKLAKWMPSYFWRAVSVITIIALVVDDPCWNQVFAQCAPPAANNIANSTPTTRITSYTYDSDGRTTQMNTPEGYINYGYDPATGRLTSTCTTNSYIAYGYDALGRLQTVHVTERNGATVNECTTNHYDKVGNRSEVDLPNGVVTKYYYDTLNRLTNMTHQSGTTNLAAYSYTLNASGRRTNAVEVLLTETGTYYTNNLSWQFDGMYRLTNEVNLCSVSGASYTNSYVYDLAGNRLKLTQIAGNTVITTNSYDANDELLREVTQTGGTLTQTNNYAYDPNGSLIGKTNISSSANTITYTYDLRNNLSTVALNGAVQITNQYNDQGIRVRTMSASSKYYLIDANNHTGYQQVLEKFSTLGGTPTMSYVIGDEVLGQAVTGPASYLLADGHGSTRQMVSAMGGVAERYNYDAYGVMQTVTSSSTAEYAAANVTSKLYCGEQYDSVLQMYNLRARYYNPSNGRFNQRDTFRADNSDPQSLHKYLYGNCDPVNRVDPTGQFSLVELLVVIAIIGVLAALLLPAISAAKRSARRTSLVSDLNSMVESTCSSEDEWKNMAPANLVTPINVGDPNGNLATGYGLPYPKSNRGDYWKWLRFYSAFRRGYPGTSSGEPLLLFNTHLINEPGPVQPDLGHKNWDDPPYSTEEFIAFVQDRDFTGKPPPADKSHWYCAYVGSLATVNLGLFDSQYQSHDYPFPFFVRSADDPNPDSTFHEKQYYEIPVRVTGTGLGGAVGPAINPAGSAHWINPGTY